MKPRPSNFLPTAAGFVLVLLALIASLVTVAGSDYRGELLFALACALAGLSFLAVPLRHGPPRWRWTAAIVALPALYVVVDFMQRAAYVFGGK